MPHGFPLFKRKWCSRWQDIYHKMRFRHDEIGCRLTSYGSGICKIRLDKEGNVLGANIKHGRNETKALTRDCNAYHSRAGQIKITIWSQIKILFLAFIEHVRTQI